MTEKKEKNLGGRPRKYTDPKEFDKKVDEYIKYCTKEQIPTTYTGLALYLGFSQRVAIDEYLKYEGFSNSVKRAKAIIEERYERKLQDGSPTGAIFALKNYGWSDKSQVDNISSDGSAGTTIIFEGVEVEDSDT